MVRLWILFASIMACLMLSFSAYAQDKLPEPVDPSIEAPKTQTPVKKVPAPLQPQPEAKPKLEPKPQPKAATKPPVPSEIQKKQTTQVQQSPRQQSPEQTTPKLPSVVKPGASTPAEQVQPAPPAKSEALTQVESLKGTTSLNAGSQLANQLKIYDMLLSRFLSTDGDVFNGELSLGALRRMSDRRQDIAKADLVENLYRRPWLIELSVADYRINQIGLRDIYDSGKLRGGIRWMVSNVIVTFESLDKSGTRWLQDFGLRNLISFQIHYLQTAENMLELAREKGQIRDSTYVNLVDQISTLRTQLGNTLSGLESYKSAYLEDGYLGGSHENWFALSRQALANAQPTLGIYYRSQQGYYVSYQEVGSSEALAIESLE